MSKKRDKTSQPIPNLPDKFAILSGTKLRQVGERIFATARKISKGFTESNARVLVYVATAASIAQIVGWDPAAIASVSPIIGKFVELVGANLLASMLDRVAEKDSIDPDEIQDIFKDLSTSSNLEKLLSEQKFVETLELLQRLDEDRFRYLSHQLNTIIRLLDTRKHKPSATLSDSIRLIKKMPTETLPPLGTLPQGSRMILSANPLFVGRENEIKQIARIFKGNPRHSNNELGQRVVLTGIGGIGKTQLATEFIYRYGRYFAGGVFWLNFGNAESIPDQISLCGQAMEIDIEQRFESLSLDERVTLVQKHWSDSSPSLLVFDNLDDDSAEDLLMKFRPKGGGSRILITSQNENWEPTLGITIIKLGELDNNRSADLLRKYRPDLDENLAHEISNELGNLPLALDLAGSYLSQYAKVVSPEAYLNQLRDPHLLKHKSLKGFGRRYSPTKHDLDVGRTFAISYQRLNSKNKSDRLAIAILGRASHFAPGEPIPWEMLCAAVQTAVPDEKTIVYELFMALLKINTMPRDEQVADGVRRLRQLGLVTVDTDDSVTVHRLVANFALNIPITMGRGKGPQDAVEFVIKDAALDACVSRDPRSFKDWSVHFRHVTNEAIKRSSDWANNLSSFFSEYLNLIGDYKGALEYSDQSLKVESTIFRVRDPYGGALLNNKAHQLHRVGDLKGAYDAYREALEISKHRYGSNSIQTARIKSNYGKLLLEFGDYINAKRCFEEALAVERKELGNDHPETASSLEGLGAVYLNMGNYQESLTYFEEELALEEKMYGPDHPRLSLTLSHLGTVLGDLGEFDKAHSTFSRALENAEKSLGEEHPEYISLLLNFGSFLKKNEPEKAQREYERALHISEKALGLSHVTTASCHFQLGVMFLELNKLRNAQIHFENSLAILRNAVDADNDHLVTSLVALGSVLWKQKLHSEAYKNFLEALSVTKKRYGEQHPKTAEIMLAIGINLMDFGDLENARAYLTKAVSIFGKTLGPEHPATLETQTQLGKLRG